MGDDMNPSAPRDNKPGRHCAVCGRYGGMGAAFVLKLYGYAIPPGAMAYAHPNCLRRAQLLAQEAALAELVNRCDGEAGVRADGSNIDTRWAHVVLDAPAQEEP
jgi:hypothetical protein